MAPPGYDDFEMGKINVKYGPRSLMEAMHTGESRPRVCPRCGSTEVHRSHTRTAGERRLRRLLPIRYWRCHDCDHREARLDWGRARKMIANIAFWVLVAVTFLLYRRLS